MKHITHSMNVSIIAILLIVSLLTAGCGGGGGSSKSSSSSLGTSSSSSSPSTSTTPAEELAVFDLNPPLVKSEEEKQQEVNDSTRPYRYIFDTPVTFYVADAPGKPAAVPGIRPTSPRVIDAIDDTILNNPVPVYNSGYRAAFVEEGADEKRWFAFTVDSTDARGIVWQVSVRPFIGDDTDWRNPDGLIASGTQGMVDGYNGEFSIDFANLGLKDILTTRYGSDAMDVRLSPKQMPVYVRAVAIDSDGNAIGEMGRGIEVLYGDRLSIASSNSGFVPVFNLLTPVGAGDPYSDKEFLKLMDNFTEHACNLVDSYNWYFRPEGFPPEAEAIRLQVTTYPGSLTQEDWRDPIGLVYEKVLTKGSNPFDQLPNYMTTIPIDFSQFAKVGTQYYVRAVALSAGSDVGTVKATYSKTVLFSCVPDDGTDIVYYPPPEPMQITPELPEVTLLRYEPIKWEDPEWMYWYQIVRRPTVKELTFGLIPDDSLAEGYAIGDYFKLTPPSQEDKAWYEEAWDAISDFFSDLIDYVSKVTDWVASKYNSAKAYLINVVAENLPGVPQGWRGYLKDALEYTVDYGMASMGIPPELPTFDQLTEEGLDYMASNALDMAGIPDTDLTNGMVQDLADDLGETLNNAATSGNTPNPLGWTFVRQYPGTMYRPAYLLVKVHNPYGVKMPSGTLRGSVTRTVTTSELADPDISTLSAAFGGTHYFELYRRVNDVKIPPLLPGQTITVPVYLKEYTGAKYSFSPTIVTQNYFLKMYNELEPFTFSFIIDFDLPSAETYALQHGLGESSDGYKYVGKNRGFSFTTDPAYSYVP